MLLLAAAAWSRRSFLIATTTCTGDRCISEGSRTYSFGGRSLTLKQEFKDRSGTGYGIWECSERLAAYLEGSEILRGHRILELGCGCGLVAIVATLNGGEVLATDGDDGVLDLARRNFHRNHFNITTAQLKWQDASSTSSPFDVVLGADLTYFPGTAVPLANAMLASGAPTAIIAHKRRTPQDDKTIDTLESFFGPVTTLASSGKVSILRFQRRPDAPPDLDDILHASVACNPGYKSVGTACVLDATTTGDQFFNGRK